MEAVARKAGGNSKAPANIPFVGDEVSLTLVTAKPQDFVDKSFYVVGSVGVSDFYISSYRDAKPTHYSFDCFPVDKQGGRSNRIALYQLRTMGDDLVTAAVNRGGNNFLLRVKITISSHFVKTYEDAGNTYELLDWQFIGDDGKWTPWHSETITPEQPNCTSSTNNPVDHVGPRGGEYHYSKNGNKVYNKK